MTTKRQVKAEPIEFNEGFVRALAAMEEGDDNVLITGKAGTGKSTLLNHFRNTTKKSVAVLAPTGVAAINVQGQTIHSFFGFRPDITPEKVRKLPRERLDLYESLDAVVIDEVSMLRADLLDCIEKFLRLNGPSKGKPFGGTKMIFVGDAYQLPPVVTPRDKELFSSFYQSPYFFDSKAFQRAAVEYIELEKIYRQKDGQFIGLLNAIRNSTLTDSHIRLLNTRCTDDSEGSLDVTLTSVNERADQINEERLGLLEGKLHHFKAKIKGNMEENQYPTSEWLQLKEGAQVMMLNNDSDGRWVNGTMARVTRFTQESGKSESVIAVLDDRQEVEVSPFRLDVFRYVFVPASQSLGTQSVGSFTQHPLRLAWAVTIHKSQGKTFDRVRLDLSRGLFAPGQLYVALSRCRTLEGIQLTKPVGKKHAWVDWRVVKFSTGQQYDHSEKTLPLNEKMDILKDAIENRTKLHITYLKSDDSKSTRDILPKRAETMEYMGKKFPGLEAYCFKRKEDRTFRIDRILEIRPA
ncbi:MAG TPA: AAA family ATPase [Candidatus Norongarragalinales archaeon]|nr:AAA family ATPase [Candidatus Norongarragalinales archaeon]